MSEQSRPTVNGTAPHRYQGEQEEPYATSSTGAHGAAQTQTDSGAAGAAAAGATETNAPFPWRRFLNRLSWLVVVATFVYQLAQHALRLPEAIALSIVTGLAVKVGGELVGFVWRWFWALMATGVAVGACVAGTVASNPHCLHPVTAGDEEEQAICFYLSTFAPTLPPVVEVTTGLVLPEGHGLLLPDMQDPARAAGAFALPPLFGPGTALAQPSPTEPPENFSRTDRNRFNTCITSLYEDPALTLEAWLIRQKRMPDAMAHDLIMNKLLGVCQLYMQRQIDDLRPYYARAVGNAFKQEMRNAQRYVSCEILVEMPQTCLREPLLLMKGESLAFERALCNLKVEQRALIDRWLEGGSWKEIGQDLGLTESSAANRFNSAIRSIQGYIESQTCQSNYR